MSRKDFEDDGRTVADMSGIERPPLIMPRRTKTDKTASQAPEGQQNDRPWESTFTPKERRIAVFAALKASLLIGLCYIVGLGAVILLLIWLWK